MNTPAVFICWGLTSDECGKVVPHQECFLEWRKSTSVMSVYLHTTIHSYIQIGPLTAYLCC